MEAVDFKKSAQLDLLVVPQAELHHILDVRSLRAEALASHHFLVLARFARDLIARTFSILGPLLATGSTGYNSYGLDSAGYWRH